MRHGAVGDLGGLHSRVRVRVPALCQDAVGTRRLADVNGTGDTLQTGTAGV